MISTGLIRHYGTQHSDYQDCLSAKQQLGTILQSVPDLLKSSVSVTFLINYFFSVYLVYCINKCYTFLTSRKTLFSCVNYRGKLWALIVLCSPIVNSCVRDVSWNIQGRVTSRECFSSWVYEETFDRVKLKHWDGVWLIHVLCLLTVFWHFIVYKPASVPKFALQSAWFDAIAWSNGGRSRI